MLTGNRVRLHRLIREYLIIILIMKGQMTVIRHSTLGQTSILSSNNLHVAGPFYSSSGLFCPLILPSPLSLYIPAWIFHSPTGPLKYPKFSCSSCFLFLLSYKVQVVPPTLMLDGLLTAHQLVTGEFWPLVLSCYPLATSPVSLWVLVITLYVERSLTE